MPRRRTVTSRAFTMIEMLVVMVILAVIAAMVAPRVFRSTDRDAQAAVDSLAELVSVAARRDEFASQPLAIALDAERGKVDLWSRTVDAATGRPVWKPDPLTPSADMSALVINEVTSDGVELDARRWWYEFPQNVRRPSLVLSVASAITGHTWTVELQPTSSRAIVSDAAGMRSQDQIGAIDLDATGKADAPW